MPRALLSVSDKSGLVDFAKGLAALGFELVSTGGTAKALRDAGLAPRDISDVTKFPEMLDGRVKTLHPMVHGGLLARRDLSEHMKTIAEHGIEPIDVVCVNLYPFRETAKKAGIEPDHVIEQIDIGGPSMLRSAAKNFAAVTVVVDPADYARVLASLAPGAKDAQDLRRELAAKVYAHTAAYDSAIAAWFAEQRGDRFPERLTLAFERQQPLRYGENPEQRAASCRGAERNSRSTTSSTSKERSSPSATSRASTPARSSSTPRPAVWRRVPRQPRPTRRHWRAIR
jgi:phosphoribosylaminoimidazolecarboxamide formyltransferase/IMP cyclohydrolase